MNTLHSLLGPDLKGALLIILNLILIESLLSVDNAAVLATIVSGLPAEQRSKALKYGIAGAYVLRGLCLVLAGWLVKIWWLKAAGGFYLLYIALNYFKEKFSAKTIDNNGQVKKQENWLYQKTSGVVGELWATIIVVEIMDLAFSIDNVFAAVAFTSNIFLICCGVFIGILAMRFVARLFVKLMERFAFLESAAFAVIAVLGIKLSISLFVHFYPGAGFSNIIEGNKTDVLISIFTVAVFILPVITSLLFNIPKRNGRTAICSPAEDVLDKS